MRARIANICFAIAISFVSMPIVAGNLPKDITDPKNIDKALFENNAVTVIEVTASEEFLVSFHSDVTKKLKSLFDKGSIHVIQWAPDTYRYLVPSKSEKVLDQMYESFVPIGLQYMKVQASGGPNCKINVASASETQTDLIELAQSSEPRPKLTVSVYSGCIWANCHGVQSLIGPSCPC